MFKTAGAPFVMLIKKLRVGWKYPTLAAMNAVPTIPFRTKLQVAVPVASVRTTPPDALLRAPGGPAEPPTVIPTLGIGAPVIEVTTTTTAAGIVEPAWPVIEAPIAGDV